VSIYERDIPNTCEFFVECQPSVSVCEMATPFHRGIIADAAAAEEEPKLVARPSIELEKKADDQVLRVWHLDDCMGSFDEKDVAAGADFTAFKCIRASTSTATKTVVDSIGRKLLVADASLFRLYAINSQST